MSVVMAVMQSVMLVEPVVEFTTLTLLPRMPATEIAATNCAGDDGTGAG